MKIYDVLVGVNVLLWLDLVWISVAVISSLFVESYILLNILCIWLTVTRGRALCNIENTLIENENQE